jgi:hypothetical protein
MNKVQKPSDSECYISSSEPIDFVGAKCADLVGHLQTHKLVLQVGSYKTTAILACSFQVGVVLQPSRAQF